MLITLGIAAWTTFLSFQPEPLMHKDTSYLPDGFMENVTAWIMNKEGEPSMKIITPKLIHYLKDDKSELTAPQITLYRNSPNPWLISSNFATALNGTEQINFQNNVVITHAADIKLPETLIKTNKLTVKPEKQTAETAELITMIQPNLKIQGLGMFANIDTGYINLKSHTRGEYVPN